MSDELDRFRSFLTSSGFHDNSMGSVEIWAYNKEGYDHEGDTIQLPTAASLFPTALGGGIGVESESDIVTHIQVKFGKRGVIVYAGEDKEFFGENDNDFNEFSSVINRHLFGARLGDI